MQAAGPWQTHLRGVLGDLGIELLRLDTELVLRQRGRGRRVSAAPLPLCLPRLVSDGGRHTWMREKSATWSLSSDLSFCSSSSSTRASAQIPSRGCRCGEN